MAPRLISCFIMMATFVPSVFGQATYDGCVDIRGIPVLSIASNVNDVAVASLAPNGAPIVQYNPSVLSFFHPKTRLFWYAHECGHHALGHAFGTAHPLAREQQADCWGITTLVREQILDNDDVRIVQNDLSHISSGDWTHLPGPQRAINLSQCLRIERVTGDAADCEDRCVAQSDNCLDRCDRNRDPDRCRDRCEQTQDRCQARCDGGNAPRGGNGGNGGSGSGGTSALPRYCCTAVGKLGPYPNPGYQVGEQCWGMTPYGTVYGQACH